MRRALTLIVASAMALAAAAAAIAVTTDGGLTTTTATVSAAKDKADSRTCKGVDGDYTITNGRYAGKIDFAEAENSDLDGDIVIRARTVQKTGGAGYLEGSFRIAGTEHRGSGRIFATLDGGGKLDGFVNGVVGGRRAILIGDVSATFTADAGFTGGKIGNGDTSLPAVLVAHPCRAVKPVKPVKPEHKQTEIFRGTVVGPLSATSITVHTDKGDKTCGVKDGKPSLDGLAVDANVAVLCVHGDGDTLTLLKLVKTDKPVKPVKPEHKQIEIFRGTVVGPLSATSITVHTDKGDKTCGVKDGKPSLDGLAVDANVAVLCVHGDGDTLTLLKLVKLLPHPAPATTTTTT